MDMLQKNSVIISGEYSKSVVRLIDSAKTSLDIIAFDWRWYEGNPGNPMQQINLAILRAISRGVYIRAILNHKHNLALFNSLKIHARVLRHKRPLHTKLILIDNKTIISGSHNMTRSALALNHEVSFVIYDVDLVDRLSLYFNRLYDFV